MYASLFRAGSVQPLVHTMLAMGALGYAFEYSHIMHEYKANPPPWSRYAKKSE
eukprot:m.101428 g.101428  ORF g.101428 m.101428 type:complete len:53 (+) comp8965_c0_seq1:240-398(+)